MILVFSDIHANVEAFNAVIDDAHSRAKIAEYICLGDTFTLGPDPVAVFDALARLPYPGTWLHGNHEDYILDANIFAESVRPEKTAGSTLHQILSASYLWTRTQLGPQRLQTIGQRLQKNSVRRRHQRNLLFIHASPDNNDIMMTDEDVLQNFEDHQCDCIIGGHSHRQVRARYVCGTYINVGSVGMPFDRDPRACYALVDRDGDIHTHRVSYDRQPCLNRLGESQDPFARLAMDNLQQARVVPFQAEENDT